MTTNHRTKVASVATRAGVKHSIAAVIWTTLSAGSIAGETDIDIGREQRDGHFCSATAAALFHACAGQTVEHWYLARAICINVSDPARRKACFEQAQASRGDERELCRAQLTGRRAACGALGEARYDPKFDPAQFDTDFKNLTRPNPYFPLAIGNRWEYAGGDEFNTLEVLDQTKLIDGVTCVVVRDQVFKSGDLAENTDDWFCQAKTGDVYYFGEEVKDMESFDGDHPRVPELIDNHGSFKQGRDGDKGGLFFAAAPTPGLVYLEEFSLGNAEDVTEILSTNYAFGRDPVLDALVPPQLAGRFCRSDCIVTKNYSLLEPGAFAYKYYARGIGFILEVKPQTGIAVQLVNCNFDSRCAGLPKP